MAVAKDSLERFFVEVRSSCTEHAKRKGYTDSGVDQHNTLREVTDALGISQEHALGEIVAKLLEFRRAPRKVIAEKIAGWAWRLWLTCEE